MDGNKNINLENLSDFKKNIDNVINSLTKSIELPIATTDTLGGIKPDNNTNFVDEDGVLRVVGSLDKIMLVPSTNDNFTYDGTEHSPVWQNYDEDMLSISGETSGTNAGIYTTVFTPKEEYIWGDGVKKAKSVSWNIKCIVLTTPTKSGNLTYTGIAQSPTWENYDGNKITIGGTTSATEVGSYTTTFTPKENYQWSDGTNTTKSVDWSIEKAVVTLPTQSGTLVYNGLELSPVWNNYNDTKLTISGITTGTNAGTYTATFTPKEGYIWSDNTEESKSVNWTINRASITTTPSQNGTLTYTGSAQSPTWSNYDSNKMTISGTTSGTNASSYTATFTPKSNYQWNDGTTSSKNVTWNIGKAAGSLSLNKSSVTLNASTLTTTVSVTRAGNGTITATSSDTSTATVSISGTTLTITAKKNGTVTITVSVGVGTNYTAPSNKTISVTVSGLISSVLNENTVPQIISVTKAGNAPNYWSVGDTIGIKLNGTVGDITFNNETYYAYIIGFNHNSTIEGNNTIHFQFGKNADGKTLAFCDNSYANDSTYGQNVTSTGFIMNTNYSNVGGWKDSYMRNTICPAFLAAMPIEWRNVIKPCTKYTDNTGGGGNEASRITATSDSIWLLAEYELIGERYKANISEQNYQQRYDYYRNSNFEQPYNHLSPNSGCSVWTRSPSSEEAPAYGAPTPWFVGAFYQNYTGPRYLHTNTPAYISMGFMPCFMIA